MRAVAASTDWTRLRPGDRVMFKHPDKDFFPEVGTVVSVRTERPMMVAVEYVKTWKHNKRTMTSKKTFQLPPEYILGEVSR